MDIYNYYFIFSSYYSNIIKVIKMPFIICEDQKQNISLGSNSWQTIFDDMYNFYDNDYERNNLSGFINRILSNFYESAKSSLSFSIERYDQEITKNLEHIKKDETFDKIRKSLVTSFVKSIIYNRNERKLIPRKIRLNNQNYNYLIEESMDDAYYRGSSGLYIRAILEEYCFMAAAEREKIHFANLIEIFESAIKNRSQVKVKIRSGRVDIFKPFKVVTDKFNNFSYFVGVNENYQLFSFRISRVTSLKEMKSKSGFITIKEKADLDNLILDSGPQFLISPKETIIVKLTDLGKIKYSNNIYLRPAYLKIENDIYYFNCSETQAYFYFFKFGSDVEIIEPLGLKNKFISEYKKAYEIYTGTSRI